MSYDWKLPSPCTSLRMDASADLWSGPPRSAADVRRRAAAGMPINPAKFAAPKSAKESRQPILREDAAPAAGPVRSSAELRQRLAAGQQ